MTKTKRKTITVLGIIITALMILAMVFNDVQAAAPRLIKGDFENPAQGVRLDGKYSDGLDVTGDTTVEVIGGKNRRVADSNVDNIFTNFDNDYNAGWVRYPGAKDGFHKGQNRIFTGDYNDLTGHITADENAARGFQKWNMFNLKNAANNEIKIKVSNLNYYNADKATGRDGNNDKINAIITINSWDVATSSNDSALVENFSFSESTPNFSYDEAVERLESSDCRCSSLWSKDNNGKYTYDRPDSDPYLIVSINTKSGLPGIRTARLQNVKYTVEFEYAEDTADGKHEAGDSAKLSTNVSATDIDTQQGVHMTPGGTSHVEAYAIPDNSSFTYNGGEVLIEEGGKYKFEFNDQRPPENRDNKPYDAFAIYTDTDKYSMTFISGYQGQGGYSYFAQTSAPSVFYTPNDPVKTIGWTGENNDETHDGRTAESRTNKGITANMTEAQKWAKVRSLTRDDLVSNKDNASGQNAKQSALIDAINTLFNRKITFKISHRVGNDYNDYNKFSKYRIKDTFDPAFELITEGEDAPKMSGGGSSNFTVTTNGQYVEANANDPKADSLYGNDHILVVKAYLRKEMFDLYGGNLKISDYINSEGRLIAVPNTAQVVIDDGGPAWTAGQTEDSTLNQFVKSTDTTFATVVVPKPKKENLEKYVADADNRKLTGKGTTAVGDGYKEIYNLLSPGGLTENTLDNPIDDYTYYVAQSLNQGYTPYWYFKSFEITDSVENQPLKIVDGSAKVHRVVITKDGENVTYSKPSNSDATSDFDISIENGTKIKATAKAASLNNQNFYRQSDGKANRYVLEFMVKIDKSQYDYKPQIDKWFDDAISAGESKGYTWKNTANVKITDNADPDLTQNSEEQAAASWDKNSNETKTHIFAPRFEVTKTTNPYEFQVGDDIPYTIKIKNIEQNTTAGWVEGIDAYNTADDFPDGYTIKDVKATGGTDPNAEVVESKKIKMTATKLPYNEELTTTFKAVADKTLNGKVLKNTAYARAWGIETDSDFSKWAAKANTSVYINSPKLNVTKEKVSERIDSSSNNKIDYKTEITNVNPGTFMRNIYAIDTSETKGLTIDMSSITVKNSGEGTLKEGRDYVIETYSADKVNMYNITGEDDEFYTITTSSEKAQNTGDQLPSAAYGGFYIKFIGKYRNLGYQDKTIPATSDERGKTATYLSDELKASEKKYGGVDYTTDYANLDLKDKIVIYYSMTQNADFDENAKNFIRTPATENTNGDMINNNDDLPKAGDPKVASGGDFAENTIKIEHRGEPGKSVDEEQATKDAELHYTISGKNTGDEIIKDPELVDTLVTKNFECDKNSFKVYKNSTDDKNLLSSDKYTITHDDANYKFTVKVPGANLKQGESIVVTYSGVVTKDIKSTDGSKRVQELTEEEVVHNKVTFMGSDAQVWTPNNDPENPNPKLTKDVKEKTTQVGGTLHYTITGENVSGAAAKDVVFEDEIKTKNLKYNQDSIKVVFIKGSDKSETDLTSSLKEGNKITFTDDSFKVETGKDLDKGDKIVITYSGEVQKSDDESIKSVDNEVVMTGSNFSALKDNEKVPFGNPEIEKTAQTPNTWEGKVIPYDAHFTNKDDEVWRNVVLSDEITTKNAEYNKDFKIYVNDNEITSSCKIEYGEYSVSIKTGKDISKGDTIRMTYSITTTDGEWVDNKFTTTDAEGRNAVAYEKVPPVTHEKAVKESEHDGPDGERNVLHYTLTSKHNGSNEPLKNVVITDTVLSKNLTFNDDIKVEKGGTDITADCTITMAEDKMSFEIKLKDPLNPGETIITTYSGNVKDRNQVDNETVLRADGIKGIKDDEHVPGPGDGDFMTVYKDSDPVTDSKVNAGDTITYILKAVNTGKSVIKFGHIRDYIPEGTTFESVQNGGVFVKDKNYCEWVIKDLKPGEENAQTVTFKVKVNTVNTPKEIFNHALYQKYNENPGTPGSIPNDPKLKTRYVRHYTTPTDPNPRTIIVAKKSCKPASGSTVKVGDTIKYTITLENQGNKDATSVGVRDYIPEGTKFVSAEDGGNYDSTKNCVDWMNIKIAGKSKVTVSFTVEVAEKAKELGKVVNQALYQDEWTDPEKDPSSSTNKVVHPVQDIPMKHTKTADKKSTYKGQVVKYTLTTKILGNVKKVVITDKINSKNFKYDQKSLKVKFNGKDVTKKVKTTFKGYSFTIKTGMSAKKGDVFKVIYKGTAINGKKIINTSTAYAKGIKPIKAKHKIPPKKKPGKPIIHKKSAAEKATAKGRTIHYTLTTNIRGSVKKVVITDKVKSQNYKYNRKSIKVFFNGKNVTKKMKDISFDKYSFVIKTGMNAKKGDKFKVTYSGKTTNNQKVVNESSAYAKGIKPVKAKETVPPDKGAPSPKGRSNSTAKTGDDFKLPIILGLFAIACLITIFILSRRKKMSK